MIDYILSYLILEKLQTSPASESVPKIWMLISQLHPRSQATVFIFVVFFQQLLTSPNAGLRFILPGQVCDIQ
jgi:hypothetical protein